MTLSVFTNSDWLSDYPSVMLLSVSPIVGGRVASFAYAIAARGACLGNIDNRISNCQGGGVKAMVKGIWAIADNLCTPTVHRFNYG